MSGDSQPIGSSDDDSEESVNSDTSSEDEVVLTPSGDAWQKDANYSPLEAPLEKFQDNFMSTGQSRRMKTGLQCSPIDVNTPIWAWREVFKIQSSKRSSVTPTSTDNFMPKGGKTSVRRILSHSLRCSSCLPFKNKKTSHHIGFRIIVFWNA